MISIDFEYNKDQVILCCAENTKTGEAFIFDLRNNKQTGDLSDWVKKNLEEIFCSYALAAEIDSFCRLGIDTSKMRCIDLMAECRMISMSHQDYFVPDGTLVGHLSKFLKLETSETRLVKERMRALILNNSSWNDEEWEEIVYYCLTDIAPLKDLFEKVRDIHKEAKTPYKLSDALDRGEYVRMCAEMDFASKGFPVDVEAIEKIYGNKDQIKRNIIQSLPPIWRFCYILKKNGKYALSRAEVLKVIKKNNWSWKLTENKLPTLEAKYLKEIEIQYPEVKSLRQAQQSLVTLNSADLREQVNDGYIKPRTNSFAAKTGRNGLKPKQGYLLNLPKWMRKIIHAHKNQVLVAVDWSQQEIAIAAILSGDKKMLDAYNSGDLYLQLGKLAGHIPLDGTKESHRKERELFKALQLALGYGKGVKSLAKDFMGIMSDQKITEIEAQLLAKEVYDWHKTYFIDYWSWIEEQVKEARLNGYIKTIDGWICFVNNRTLRTQLLNFPSQANGASLMRAATKEFYRLYLDQKLPPLLCSQHDAFYFTESEPKKGSLLGQISMILGQKQGILGHFGVRFGVKIWTFSDNYAPEGLTTEQVKLWNMQMASPNESF